MPVWKIDADLITTYLFDVEAETYEEAVDTAVEIVRNGMLEAYTDDLWVEAYQNEGA